MTQEKTTGCQLTFTDLTKTNEPTTQELSETIHKNVRKLKRWTYLLILLTLINAALFITCVAFSE